MVALPAVKFIFLGVRQLTRPVVRRVVTRAMEGKGVTYNVCIGLGRVSLGLTGVIGEWSRTEEQKRLENKKKMEEAAKAEAAKKAEAEAAEVKAKAEEAAPAITITSALRKAEPAKPAEDTDPEKLHHTSLDSLVAPRSRSLLAEITYGPLPKDQDTYDKSVFLDPKRTAGEAARVFIWHPYRSAWDVFRQTFLVPFPEKRLVDAGAELLIELSAYFVLALLLFWELRQQSRTTAAKEEFLQARLEAIEAKVNELARLTQQYADSKMVEELPPVPELKLDGRLHALWKVTELGVTLVHQALFEDSSATPPPPVKHSSEKGSSGGAVLSYSGNSRVPQQTPDPRVKLSKHDESAPMKKELERVLRDSGIAVNK